MAGKTPDSPLKLANQSRIWKTQRNQYMVRLPAAIAQAMGLTGGELVEWRMSGAGDLILRKI
jgi:antitoxin component of MazEF toxin-antitoxin module